MCALCCWTVIAFKILQWNTQEKNIWGQKGEFILTFQFPFNITEFITALNFFVSFLKCLVPCTTFYWLTLLQLLTYVILLYAYNHLRVRIPRGNEKSFKISVQLCLSLERVPWKVYSRSLDDVVLLQRCCCYSLTLINTSFHLKSMDLSMTLILDIQLRYCVLRAVFVMCLCQQLV